MMNPIQNAMRLLELSNLDPRDPDHEDLEGLQVEWAKRYADEYAEHGTMAGEDCTDLELDTELEEAKQTAIELMVFGAAQTTKDIAWRAYASRLMELIKQSAEDAVSDNWDEIKKQFMKEIEEAHYDL